MQYKTIILELLQQRPEIHEQLRKDRKLLPAMEFYARELKTSHEAWKETLSQGAHRHNRVKQLCRNLLGVLRVWALGARS